MLFEDPELKPCPFCGKDKCTTFLTPGLAWVTGCQECGCRTPEYPRSIDAVAAWNRRAEDTEDTHE